MKSRDSFARSWQHGQPTTQKRRIDHLSNLPLYATALMCVLTTAFAFWLQSGRSETPQFSQPQAALLPAEEVVENPQPVSATPQPTARPDVVEAPETVTRAASVEALQSAPVLAKSDAPVSHQLRRPIRLIQMDSQVYDLRTLATEALTGFGHPVSEGDRLHTLLVTTLSQGQSDAYIDAALNAARVRGEFVTPNALKTVSGRIDTQALLTSVLMLSRGARAEPEPFGDEHILSASDSLAGLALRYYGEPTEFAAILKANAPLQQGMNVALSGARIEIPTL